MLIICQSLLIQIIHRIGRRAERRIDKELVNDFKEVSGKTNLLFRIAEVAVESPSGVIEKVIYPVVSQKTLHNLVAEYKATGTAYRQRVHTVMRASFASHYRRMIPQLLEVLEFRSNNEIHRNAYPNLIPILTRPINWDLIRQQYEQMVK